MSDGQDQGDNKVAAVPSTTPARSKQSSVSQNTDDQRSLVTRLAADLVRHKDLYYRGEPTIADADYDALEERLRALAPDHPALELVGGGLAVTAPKVPHDPPMLSLAKTYDLAELINWIGAAPVVGTIKIDGVSLSVSYGADGKRLLCKTRGDGRLGEDVTSRVAWVADIPTKLTWQHPVEVRGELFCTETNFVHLVEAMAARGLEKPTSPRNIVAGLLGRKLGYELTLFFNFKAFDVIPMAVNRNNLDAKDQKIAGQLRRNFEPFTTEHGKFDWLLKMGFSIPDHRLIKSPAAVKSYLEHVRSVIGIGELGIDGAVFCYDDLERHRSLGSTAHHPRYKLSFKWQGETAQTTVKAVRWATSRLGIVTPVAEVAPVTLSGAKITNVTLHNAAHVKTYNIKPADLIEIVRSGEVIPKFLRVVEASEGEADLPSNCPTCSSSLVFDDVRLRCENTGRCEAQQAGAILNWIKAVGIDDLSDKRLALLMTTIQVRSPADLYRLTKEDLLSLPGTKERLAEKLKANIDRSRQVPLEAFLTGLGINGIGQTSWEKLTERFGDLSGLRQASIVEIAEVEGFADKTAEQVVLGLQEKSALIEELFGVGVQPVVSGQSADQDHSSTNHKAALKGVTIVLTGALSRPRPEVVALIKGAGGKVVGSVSSNTTYVVTDDPSANSSKLSKARQLGTEIISEVELLQLIGS